MNEQHSQQDIDSLLQSVVRAAAREAPALHEHTDEERGPAQEDNNRSRGTISRLFDELVAEVNNCFPEGNHRLHLESIDEMAYSFFHLCLSQTGYTALFEDKHHRRFSLHIDQSLLKQCSNEFIAMLEKSVCRMLDKEIASCRCIRKAYDESQSFAVMAPETPVVIGSIKVADLSGDVFSGMISLCFSYEIMSDVSEEIG